MHSLGLAPHRTSSSVDSKPMPPANLWVADITYVPTWAGFLFLAIVVDAFSRRVVGWSMANHVRTELVLEALNMALWRRRPLDGFGGRLLRDGRTFSTQAEGPTWRSSSTSIGWYNPHRRHSRLDYRSPVNLEMNYQQAA